MSAADKIIERLEEIAAAQRASAAVWLDAVGVAVRISQTKRYVLERLACLPDFPKPARIHGFGQPRWKASDIDEWMEAQRTPTPRGKIAA